MRKENFGIFYDHRKGKSFLVIFEYHIWRSPLEIPEFENSCITKSDCIILKGESYYGRGKIAVASCFCSRTSDRI